MEPSWLIHLPKTLPPKATMLGSSFQLIKLGNTFRP
jgi:hypothetical protein